MGEAEHGGTHEQVLRECFPGALMIEAIEPEEVISNFRSCGIGVMSILTQDGGVLNVTYLAEETMETQALMKIFEDEQAGLLPAGSHEQAVNDILDGRFNEHWIEFFPRQDES